MSWSNGAYGSCEVAVALESRIRGRSNQRGHAHLMVRDWRSRQTTSRRRRPPTPPVPEPQVSGMTTGAYSFVTPSGDRDRWEVDYGRGVAIRWHAKPRQHLFVPGHCAGGPALNRLTGERRTYAKFPNGDVRVVEDNYLTKTKPAQVLADREWRGRTELRLHPEPKTEPSDGRKER